MNAVLITVLIIAVITAVFYIPVYADIVLGDENSVIIGYAFFKKKVFPMKSSGKKKPSGGKKKKPDKPEPPQKKKTKTDSEDFKEILELVKSQIPNLKAYIKALLGAFKIRRLNVSWSIGGEDACETAVKYGRYSGLFYTVYSMLALLIDIKPEKITISPDFLSEEGKLETNMRVYLIPAKVISSTLVFAFRFLADYLKLNNKNEKVECKDGTEERTSC